jgi:aspartate/methionine/tyrosine aminotransferase
VLEIVDSSKLMIYQFFFLNFSFFHCIYFFQPHNPTGAVFNRSQLESIAELLQAHPNVIAITDEVYEFCFVFFFFSFFFISFQQKRHMLFDGEEHVRFASLPGMYDRTLTVSSAGKTFNITGWKIGWGVGPAHLIKPIAVIHQFICWSISTPFQEAIANSFEIAANEPFHGFENYYAWLDAQYQENRELLLEALRSAGLEPTVPKGGFFIVANTENVQIPQKYLDDPALPSRDWAFCDFLVKECGVTAIPMAPFFAPEKHESAGKWARFAFCKPKEVIIEAGKRLQVLKEKFMK